MGRALEKRLQKLARARRAAERLRAEMQQVAALAGADLLEALSVKPDAAVFRARWQGEAVVIKQFRAPDAASIVQRMKGELDYAGARLSDPRFAVNPCLLAVPEHGLIVLGAVPGRRLRDCLAEADAPERTRLLRLAADWLAAYTAPRSETAGFGARHWVRRAEATDISALSPSDQSLANALIRRIAKCALEARGTRLVRAAGHGDFVDLNLILDGQALYGVDIQGPAPLPLARMAARFLTWLQLQGDRPAAARECGLDTRDLDAFLGGGLLSDAESRRLLPVFVGDQLLVRFCEDYHAHRHRAHAVAAIESYLDAI